MSEINKLLECIRSLRDPKTGCAWLNEQSIQDLSPFLIEESYEFIEEIRKSNTPSNEALSELGDVLYIVLLNIQILDELKLSHLDQIAKKLREKLISRHPHVFSLPEGEKRPSAKDIVEAWEKSKSAKNSKSLSGTDSIANIPQNLPALSKAERIGEKVAAYNFDWPDAQSAKNKVIEEFNEFIEAKNSDHEIEELGDLLFSIAQYSRKIGQSSEEILSQAILKFSKRFKLLEDSVRSSGKSMTELSPIELDKLWQQHKQDLQKKT